MATRVQPETQAAFRLVGENDGTVTNLVLSDGEYTLGALPENDIVIAVRGVSRRHAVLCVRHGGLEVEDRGSKNGTWINGERIQARCVQSGDVISFGPAVLHVVADDRQDAELGIELLPQPDGGGPCRSEETRSDEIPATAPIRWVETLGRMGAAAAGDGTPDLHRVLDRLIEGTGSEGAAVIEWEMDGELVVLSSVGSLDGFGMSEMLRDAVREAAGPDHRRLTPLEGATSRCVWALAPRSDRDAFVLVLRRGFPGDSRAGSLLRAALPIVCSEIDAYSTAPQPSAEFAELRFPPDHVVGESMAMLGVYEQLRQLISGDIPVLILGDTGTGKEHVARILHGSSDRRSGPFVAVNCAAIPNELLEAELFGIERGVATNVDAREGRIHQADGGVLFLDEIGDMPAAVQAKLLRVLESMEVVPVGGRRSETVDVRLVTATNCNLGRLIHDGGFRQDLYYRVAAYSLELPPLRHRRKDIPKLVQHFLTVHGREVGKDVKGITVKALEALVEAPWPGNVRQLANEVRRLVYQCPPGHPIDSSLLSEDVLYPSQEEALEDDLGSSDVDLAESIERLERRLITIALGRTRGNRSRAAKLLGISRNGLALKIERLGLPS